MSVSDYFSTFCSNLRMSSDTVSTIQTRYHQITKRINIDYWNSTSETEHSLYVGSYGRGTEIWTSDIDIIVRLPYETYVKFNNYSGNGQSALLQEVKGVLQKTYSTSYLKGDGQVIGINFSDGINFEIVPAFINEDGSYTYPDTNNGGSWKITDPKKEIDAMNSRNNDTNKNLKRLCRMTRAWKQKCNVSQTSQGYKLESQIREAYGRVAYTQTCHDKFINRVLKINDRIKLWQIILSAVTTSGFVVAIFSDDKVASILGAIVSLALLILNTYTKNFNLIETAQEHKVASDLLWKIREEYVSLLTDFEIMDADKIMNKRDELQERTAEVYSNSPRTDIKSYRAAQKALKTEDEQTFSEEEIDVMLPNSIRRCNRKMIDA